jgi:short-subunit dehydrogenase
MYNYSNKSALVTGASSGIGAEFARTLAARGTNLILVARRVDRLNDLAAELSTGSTIKVITIEWDLSLPQAGMHLGDEIAKRGLNVDVLVNAAGFGTHGTVAETDPVDLSKEMALNMNAVAETTRAFLPSMLARENGVIINIASLAGFAPRPNHAMYSATKAFVLSFTQALWGELRGTGVLATAVCPGPTATEFFSVSGTPIPGGKAQPASAVVDATLKAIDADKPRVVPAPLGMRIGMALMNALPIKTALGASK